MAAKRELSSTLRNLKARRKSLGNVASYYIRTRCYLV
jgi:hypothetical protein